MTVKLVLHLSGRWESKYEHLLDSGDLLYRAPDVKHTSDRDGWEVLPRTPKNGIEELCKQYNQCIKENEKDWSQRPYFSLVNNHFLYGILAVGGQLEMINALIRDHKPSRILIFSAPNRRSSVPAIGYVNTESSLGSSDIIGSMTNMILLKGLRSELKVCTTELKGDLLVRPYALRTVQKLASTMLVIFAVIRLMFAHIRNGQKMPKDAEEIVFVRNKEHARHAARLFSQNPKAIALITPQFLAGSVPAILESLGKNLAFTFPTLADGIAAAFRAIFTSGRGNGLPTGKIAFHGFDIPVDLNELSKDYHNTKIFEFQRLLIQRTLKRYCYLKHATGFEVQGPIAWIEGCEPRREAIMSRTVQPVLVQGRPLPIFPFSDQFYVDSAPNKTMLEQVGASSLGKVIYAGPPFRVQDMGASRTIQKIGYFTQPYETAASIAVFILLCETARKIGAQVIVRLHPRDPKDNYTNTVNANGDVAEFSIDVQLDRFIQEVDVCVSRTSSIAKEAIAAGTLNINVMASNFDQEVIADYLIDKDCLVPGATVGINELDALLCDSQALKDRCIALQDQLFKALDIDDLQNALAP